MSPTGLPIRHLNQEVRAHGALLPEPLAHRRDTSESYRRVRYPNRILCGGRAMTYLASADLLAARSLAAESAFSLDHRVDLPVKRSTPGDSGGGQRNRARTFDSGIDAAVLPAPKGRHHRPEPAPAPEPVDEDPGFTVIDLRDQDTGFRIRTAPDHQRGPGALAVVIELDDYRTHHTGQSPPPTPPSPAEAGPARRVRHPAQHHARLPWPTGKAGGVMALCQAQGDTGRGERWYCIGRADHPGPPHRRSRPSPPPPERSPPRTRPPLGPHPPGGLHRHAVGRRAPRPAHALAHRDRTHPRTPRSPPTPTPRTTPGTRT